MTRKGGVGSPPYGPPILLLLLLLRASLPSSPVVPPAPFPAPLLKCRGKVLKKRDWEMEKQPGTGREASSCEMIRTGAGGVEAEGREPEGAEAAEPGADSSSPAAAVRGAGAGCARAGLPTAGTSAASRSPRAHAAPRLRGGRKSAGLGRSLVCCPQASASSPEPGSTPSLTKPPLAGPTPPASDSNTVPFPPSFPPSPSLTHAQSCPGRDQVGGGCAEEKPGEGLGE